MVGEDPLSPPESAERRRLKRLFCALEEMLRSQQSQIASLAADRAFLEDYVRLQHDRWAARLQLLQSHIAHMRKEEEKRRRMKAAMLDLAVGMKQQETLCYKKRYEFAENDLEDFRECVEALGAEILELKGKLEGKGKDPHLEAAENANEEQKSTVALEGEIRKLKHAFNKLSSRKEAEVSALLAEKDFVWNQFKKMDSDFTVILKSKRIEVDQAMEVVKKLHLNIEKLQSSVNEKDETITKLEADRARLELDRRRCSQEAERANEKIEELQLIVDKLQSSVKEKDEIIARLRGDLAEFETDTKQSTAGHSRPSRSLVSERKMRNASATPVRNRPRRVPVKRRAESANSHRNPKRLRGNQDSSMSRASNMSMQRCSKTQDSTSSARFECPRLFTANFKVPKIKDFSPTSVL